MHLSTTRSSLLQARVAAPASRRVTKMQALRSDAPSGARNESSSKADTIARLVSTGALTALVAACSLLSNDIAAHAGADLALGQQVFSGNCAACHAGGNNSVIPDHTLRKEAMEQFLTGGFTLEAITYQVENGKGAMPAWEGTLDDDEIQAVAAYVYDQASGNKW